MSHTNREIILYICRITYCALLHAPDKNIVVETLKLLLIFLEMLLVILSLQFFYGFASIQPKQLHIALAGSTAMRISWFTDEQYLGHAICSIGTSPDDLPSSASGSLSRTCSTSMMKYSALILFSYGDFSLFSSHFT
jgi:hypothetical protein